MLYRTDESTKTRLHIGGGIRLELVGEGDLYLECLSNHSVFVQSYYLDAINNRAQGSVVHKISCGTNLKVLNNTLATKLLGYFCNLGLYQLHKH